MSHPNPARLPRFVRKLGFRFGVTLLAFLFDELFRFGIGDRGGRKRLGFTCALGTHSTVANGKAVIVNRDFPELMRVPLFEFEVALDRI